MAYNFVTVLIAWLVTIVANWFIAHVGDQCTKVLILSFNTSAMVVAAEYPGSSLHECCDIYKGVLLTGETDWDYWTFSGQCLMEAELAFNELFCTLSMWFTLLFSLTTAQSECEYST